MTQVIFQPSANRPIPTSDLRAQYASIKLDVDAAIERVILSGEFERGAELDRFEEAFAGFCEAHHAVGVGSGYAALFLALKACGVGPGDQVITVANTDMATAAAILHTGAQPVFCDVDERTLNIDPALIEDKISPHTRAIVPVHLYGLPADMAPILEIARRHELLVVEDACLAIGARYRGQPVGGIGDAAALSFAPHKVLGAYGDGGMVVTNDDGIAQRARLWGSYGEDRQFETVGGVRIMLPLQHALAGYHNHLDVLQAAILHAKMKYVADWIARRQQIAALYTAELSGCDLITPFVPAGHEHIFRSYVIRVRGRAEVQRALAARGVTTAVIYAPPLHLQSALSHLGYRPGDLPVTEALADEILSLPIYPELPDESVRYVAQAVRLATG